jgi:hypothetical protein
MIFPGGERAVLQGDLRFPQVFRVVFCGEFVVVGWWNRGFCVHDFWVRKFSSVCGFIFGWVRKGNGNGFGRFALRASLLPSAERCTPFGVSFSWG